MITAHLVVLGVIVLCAAIALARLALGDRLKRYAYAVYPLSWALFYLFAASMMLMPLLAVGLSVGFLLWYLFSLRAKVKTHRKSTVVAPMLWLLQGVFYHVTQLHHSPYRVEAVLLMPFLYVFTIRAALACWEIRNPSVRRRVGPEV